MKKLNKELDTAIKITNVDFGYKRSVPVLKNLNIRVPTGSIYGFLGSNGAGKSTTIRNIIGLLKPKSGRIAILGQDLQKGTPNIFRRVGSLIEAPSFYPHLSPVDNLKIACKYLGTSKSLIEKLLDQVNLLQHRRKKTKDFSTGMKQRLGLALAMIHDPELLILDEPTSGLDPTGIIEIRNIILRLREEGKTIMLSSHLLSEIEKIASQVGIIKDGRIIFEGSLEELQTLRSSSTSVLIRTNNLHKTASLIALPTETDISNDSLVVKMDGKAQLPEIIRKLVENGQDIFEISPIKSDLEKMFIDLTNEEYA